MRIRAIVHLFFGPAMTRKRVIVEGYLHSPARPLKGDSIYWPYGEEYIGDPDNQDCELHVFASDFQTEGNGKLQPRVWLEQVRGAEPHVIVTLSEWECVFDGIRLLLLDPMYTWPDGQKQPWPVSSHHLPNFLKIDLA